MASGRKGRTAPKRPDRDTTLTVPTITIYQDPSYIEGILQQRNVGLITDSSDSVDLRTTQTLSASSEGGGEFGGNVKVPGIGGASAKASLSGGDGSISEDVTGRLSTSNFKYTSAYYLHHVRQSLGSDGLLKDVSSASDVRSLRVGDFIEFRSQFKPDKVISLMDVLNPDLVAVLTRWIRRRELLPQLQSATTEQDKYAAGVEYQTRPDAEAEVARAIAEAVRIDFRSVATREYFGSIGTSTNVTAVVVCDTRSFLVEDADRILDGHFTVFGKVSTPPTADVPVLARNKLLDRVQPEAVDWVAEQLRELAKQKIDSDPERSEEALLTIEEYINLNFESRIEGISFKVVPVAIYI